METTLWVCDSDMCECGALLGYFGECPHCGYDGIDWEDEEDPFDGPIIGTPEEAYAVELSLSDAEVERLLADVD